MKEKQSISVLPKGFGGSNLCSELAVSPDGRFVYAAARGHDAVAVLAVGAGGELTWASEAWSHADYPRSFAIDPAGRFLFACNQKGDAVTSFQIDPHSGGLTFTGQFVPVGAPVTMTFLN
jgi:6-phosphogluconolactonase